MRIKNTEAKFLSIITFTVLIACLALYWQYSIAGSDQAPGLGPNVIATESINS